MKPYHPDRRSRGQSRTYWIVGLGSLVWLILRSGTNPRRLAYPCQRAALAGSSGFVGYLVALLGAVHFYRLRQHKATLAASGLFLLLALTLTGSNAPLTSASVDLELPGWTSPSAVSDVFVVPEVAVPECSLDGGALPDTAPCNDPSYALSDAGVDLLVDEMERQRDYFYRTAGHSGGIVGADDIVVIKINDQWGGRGDNDGAGRLSTNTDLLKGLIWRVLGHPDGFTGEVVVAENTQDVNPGWDATPANAEDPNQSYQDVVDTFQGLGYAVSFLSWDALNRNLLSGGPVGGTGTYPGGEYVNGSFEDAYILLEDPAGAGTDELSYPKFQTENGSYVSMRHGIWDGSSYDADRLTFINVPVLKKHVLAGSTIAWKNLIGFVTVMDYVRRYSDPGDPDWLSRERMHNFFWGYTAGDSWDYGLIGRELALVRPPDLNVVDAIWVAIDHNAGGRALRQDVLLASRDPFAVDWYASEFMLRPSVSWGKQDSSAARSGTFRDATRTNQNAAQAVWPGGAYPYVDLLDAYDGDVPSNDEKNQMNVYLATGASVCAAISGVGISGPNVGFTDIPSILSAVITPSTASTPITYTWSPEPDSGQATASAWYQWGTLDTYSVTLEAENCGGGGSATHNITIIEAQWHVYLPVNLK